jgi:hypothetical protein
MGRMGNTFGSQTVSVGHARKVWREVKDQFPAGGVVSNLSDWLTNSVGKIPAGTFCKWYDDASNQGGKKVVCYTDAQIADATEDHYNKVASPTGNPKTKGYYELSEEEYVATTDTSVTANKDYYEKVDAVGVASLGINGATLYDIDIEAGDTVGTATVVYAGEIYSYMIPSATLALVKDLVALAEIKFVS